ncbi:DUF3857 domain-containing protein [Hyunsoonleella pacifica]|uniref:DUF3857 domain-containing protein n=1 Tax=Hyunsoonleella pacifica TaxID=1080224 RepID=A0A4Q9FLB5_9FLAO|nr:DUF3857 domain-containing protein [Hyunsoonleella pacifica]TBN14480.1 DUF3857 domain-containing protein [Hyunsoonleella pacifica]GGD14088.1 hypothetical protein GCM10011368_15090 [Hyunsoonleella pacifica]
MKRVYIIVLLTICVRVLSAQSEIKFGEVTKEELLEKEYVNDKSANAVVLYKNRLTYYSQNFDLVTEVHERIKIYNKEGFDNATKRISLFKSRSSKELLGRLKAYTYNLENGEVVKTKLDKEQIFEENISYNYKGVSFTMPNIKEGSVIEFKYKITSPFIWNIDEFKLQYDIPIKKVDAELRTPDGLNFKATQKGFLFINSQKGYSGSNMNTVKYTMVNVPALKQERYVDNMDNYRSGIMFELVSIEIPGQMPHTYATSWSDVAKTIGNSEDYKDKLDKTRSFDDDLDLLLNGLNKPEEKMKLLFKHVKNKITWNGIDGKYFYNGIKKALKEKKGNVADINLTLVAMLRYAGIDANPVVLSTKDNIIPFFPTVDRLNYVIAYAEIGEERYFLDATDEFSDINVLPIKDYNWKGIYINNLNRRWNLINIKQPEQSKEQYMVQTEINEDGSIQGHLSSRCSKHSALKIRKRFKDKEMDAIITDRESAMDNIEISEYKLENIDSYEGFVNESFDFYYENGVDVVGDKLFFNPFMFFAIEENPFKQDKRECPIDFGAPFSQNYIINIKLPEGYTVESQPEPVAMKMPKDLGKFVYRMRPAGNSLQLLVNFDINKAMITTVDFPFLKQLFHKMIIKEAEQVVLTKV